MLKQLLLYVGFGYYTIPAISQNNYPQVRSTSSISSFSESWDARLEKYVWGHTHPVSLKACKPAMSFKDIENCLTIGEDADVSISPDGKYFAYSIQNAYWGGHGRIRDSLAVQATTGTWRKLFPGNVKPGFFSANSTQYIYLQNDDQLCFLSMKRSEVNVIKGVLSYQQNKGEWIAWLKKNRELVVQSLQNAREKSFTDISSYQFDNTGKWLICRLNNEYRELLLYNLVSEKEYHFQSVDGYAIHKTGESLLLNIRKKTDNGIHIELRYVNLSNAVEDIIWSTTEMTIKVTSYALDNKGMQVVFTIQDSSDLTKSSLWYWKAGMNTAELKVNRETVGMQPDWIINEARFTENDQYILFFSLQQPNEYPALDSNMVKLDIWSYKDTVLHSAQQVDKYSPKKYSAVIQVDGDRAIKIVKDYFERIRAYGFPKGDYVLVAKSGKRVSYNEPNFVGDRFWEKEYLTDSTWLVSLKDGSRRLIKTSGGEENRSIQFSPEGKYLVYFDEEKQCNYFSIDLCTGKMAKISSGIPAYKLGRMDRYSRTNKTPKSYVGIAAWIKGDSSVLVYDNYDIWQLDLSGKRDAINITNGFGQRNYICFALTANGENGQYLSELKGTPILPCNAPLLLNAFNLKTKYSGIYQKILGSKGNPELLWTGPFVMDKVPATILDVQYLFANGINIFKASGTNAWIVKLQSAEESPNYFLTSDFKSYKRLTDLQPQKSFNWLKAELHRFKQKDGIIREGVLYKPENFDSSKKYPVIIVFYRDFTNKLFNFPLPDFNWSAIAPGSSPMLLLNNGYLIFAPDMYMVPLKYGPSALNVIEGAIRYLKQLPYVDHEHIGGAAHSWSAKLGAYVFTHCHSLAAMAISEGFLYGDLINMALSVNEENEQSNLENVENGFEFGNLWKNKSSWLDQTTVLNVDKATTPLLLYCGKQSSKDYQDQTLQFFNALRRLGKKAWWLQYETGSHILFGDDAKDYTIRYMQFFDHYLKGAPAPIWMTKGIPLKLKPIVTGYELDPAGNCGISCKVCKIWNEKYKK